MRRAGRVLALAACVAALGYVAFLAVLFFEQGSLIYPGVHNAVSSTVPSPPGTEAMRITTARATVDALFLPSSARGPQPVVIFTHGNGETIDNWLSALHGFQERGIGVLLVEYPGYGRSTGTPSEDSIRMALDAAYDRIATDPRVDRRRIFGFGQSLGGGAICLLARDRALRALILQSTFTSLDAFTSAYGAPAFLLRDHFDSLSTVRNFKGSVLVIHGRQDPLVPWSQGRQLAAAATHSTFRLYECGHLCWDPDHLPFWQDATPFLVSAGILPQSPAPQE
jgi:pimeloyl-ACP methyl ester carboxylesterase